MEYLGKTIRELTLTDRDILMIIVKLLSIIENIHKLGYLHMDLKEPNVMIGKENPNDLYLCDFGLTIPFMSSFTLKHIKQGSYQEFRGSVNYCSPHMQNGQTPGRRDDLINLGYAILQMIRDLPWLDSNCEDTFRLKTEMSTAELCYDLPVEFQLYMDYCNTLNYDDEPNYAFLRGLFTRLIKKNNFDSDAGFSWVDPKSPRHKMSV